MNTTPNPSLREQAAWKEIGQTVIRRRAAWGLALFFLAVIYAVPAHQHLQEWRDARQRDLPYEPVSLDLFRQMPEMLAPFREKGLTLSALIDTNRLFLRSINAHEDRLEDEWVLGQRVRPTLQALFSRWLGVGNEQAYIGRDRWLYYRPGIDYVTGPGFLNPRQLARRAAAGTEWRPAPQPDPRRAILDFSRQLEKRDITLIVMPTPIKPTVHPEQYSDRLSAASHPLQNESYAAFIAELEAEGIHVFDPSELLVRQKRETGAPLYLAADTHWRPEAMDAVARHLATSIRGDGPEESADRTFTRRPVEIAALGDIALMLDLPEQQTLYPPEPVTIQQVVTDDNQFWRPSEEAEVLVLGDSFSNIYSFEPMGWGEAGGFIEQLAYYLDAPVDRLVRNDSGAFATRDMLSRELARGRDRLKGKRVVVWQFAARELAVGDWRLIPMELREPPATQFIEPEPGTTLTVTGVVRDVSAVPRPGTVPYRDHVVAVHLVDLPDDGEAVVYMQSMQDNEWTRAARLRNGEEITLNLRPWGDVADRYDGINRSELDDFALQLQEPWWGTWPAR